MNMYFFYFEQRCFLDRSNIEMRPKLPVTKLSTSKHDYGLNARSRDLNKTKMQMERIMLG